MQSESRPISDLDVDNLLVKSPQELVSLIESVVRQLGLEFGSKPVPILGGGTVLMRLAAKEPVMYAIRDSILFRSVSVNWHLEALIGRHSSWVRALKANKPPAGADWQDWSMHCRDTCTEEVTFLFEDILFQLISLFDYIGRMVVYGLQREVDPKANWKTAFKYASDRAAKVNRTGYTIIESIVASRIVSHERAFVSKLADFRADIYHRQMHLPENIRPGMRVPTMSPRIVVPVGDLLGKWLHRVVPGVETTNPSMEQAATPLVRGALVRAIDVLRYLLEDVMINNSRERGHSFFVSESVMQHLRMPFTPFWRADRQSEAVASMRKDGPDFLMNPSSPNWPLVGPIR